jgi:hypothetical protein
MIRETDQYTAMRRSEYGYWLVERVGLIEEPGGGEHVQIVLWILPSYHLCH